jgi:hypothetical protein
LIPVYLIREVYHVGSKPNMDPSRQKRRTDSYEGPGLSVSVDPDAWEAIAQLGGQAWWVLQRKDGKEGRFVDMLTLSKSSKWKELRHTAEARGWLDTSARCWRFSFYDDEIDDIVGYNLATLAEAQEEAEVFEGGQITEIPIAAPLAPLKKRWSKFFLEPFDPISGMAEEFAVLQLLEEMGFDGAWWNERLDPAALSAPRGVIFVNRLPEWCATLAD